MVPWQLQDAPTGFSNCVSLLLRSELSFLLEPCEVLGIFGFKIGTILLK